jgi:hypothetical protein
MNWVENLQEILAKEAAGYFEARKVDKMQFQQYISELTSVDDWDDDFIETCYNIYLDKINVAGVN